MTPQSKTLKVGSTFTAKLPIADGLSGATWENSDPTKAKVDGAGKVTGVAEGSTTVIGYYSKPKKIKGSEYNVTVELAAK